MYDGDISFHIKAFIRNRVTFSQEFLQPQKLSRKKHQCTPTKNYSTIENFAPRQKHLSKLQWIRPSTIEKQLKQRSSSVTNGAMFQTMYAKRYMADIDKLRNQVRLHSKSNFEPSNTVEQPGKKIRRRTLRSNKVLNTLKV